MADEQHEQLKQTYVETWRRAFTELLAAPQFADEFKRYWEDYMNDPHSFFGSCDGPLAFFAGIILDLVPAEKLSVLNGFQRNLVTGNIQVAIQGGQDEFACSAPDFDWNAAEQRLDEYLKRFGVTLSELRRHIDPDLFYFRRKKKGIL